MDKSVEQVRDELAKEYRSDRYQDYETDLARDGFRDGFNAARPHWEREMMRKILDALMQDAGNYCACQDAPDYLMCQKHAMTFAADYLESHADKILGGKE